MIHKVINFLVMLILLTATACQFRINDGENKLMLLPATYNLENLNSKYDDYNLTAPPNYDQLARERPRLPCVKGAVKNLLIFD